MLHWFDLNILFFLNNFENWIAILFDIGFWKYKKGMHIYCHLFRLEGNGYVQYKAMIICTGMHLLLLIFEILACDNLQTNSHSWLLVFIPLMFMSLVSIGICIWAVKNERSFEVWFWSVSLYPLQSLVGYTVKYFLFVGIQFLVVFVDSFTH